MAHEKGSLSSTIKKRTQINDKLHKRKSQLQVGKKRSLTTKSREQSDKVTIQERPVATKSYRKLTYSPESLCTKHPADTLILNPQKLTSDTCPLQLREHVSLARDYNQQLKRNITYSMVDRKVL